MSYLQLQCVVFFIFLIQSIKCVEICDFSDIECMTKGAKLSHKKLMLGAEGKTEPSDPLHYDSIEGNLNVYFKFFDFVITGMADCDVTRLQCDPGNLTFEFFLRCPKIVFKHNLVFKGPLGPLDLNSQGSSVVTTEDYVIKYKGTYGKLIDETDKTPHIYIKEFDVECEPLGKVTFEPQDLVVGDKEKSELAKKFLNQNWKEMELMFRKPVMVVILKKVMRNLSDALKTYRLDQLIPKQ